MMVFQPYRSSAGSNTNGMLPLDATHSLYWEESGNPDGQPVVILHGGPGTGSDEWQKQLIDPLHFRIVCYDQRGAGKSTPTGELQNNTPLQLCEDLASLREYLGIEKWLVIGGSWGSSLALLYAQCYPHHLSGLIVRGVFLCTEKELDWFLWGLQVVFPEAWRRFSQYIPLPERHDLLQAYTRRIHNPDPVVHAPAAILWCEYETHCSTLLPGKRQNGQTSTGADPRQAINLARIQTHYFSNKFFLDDGALLRGTEKFRHVPGVIIHGRYDMICTIQSAFELHLHWPEADYQVVHNAGHAASEPGIRRALTNAINKMKKTVGGRSLSTASPL